MFNILIPLDLQQIYGNANHNPTCSTVTVLPITCSHIHEEIATCLDRVSTPSEYHWPSRKKICELSSALLPLGRIAGLRVVTILSTYLISSSFAVSAPSATIYSTSGAPESQAKPCTCGLLPKTLNSFFFKRTLFTV